MKKATNLFFRFVAVILIITCCISCGITSDAKNGSSSDLGGESSPTNEVIRVAGMTGPTGIGLVSLMEKNDKGETAQKYDFSLYASAQEIVPLLVKGEIDIAAIPANLAAIQFNKNDGLVQVIAINR